MIISEDLAKKIVNDYDYCFNIRKKQRHLINRIFKIVRLCDKGEISESEAIKKLHNLYKNKARMMHVTKKGKSK